jgi:hypothetical protein
MCWLPARTLFRCLEPNLSWISCVPLQKKSNIQIFSYKSKKPHCVVQRIDGIRIEIKNHGLAMVYMTYTRLISDIVLLLYFSISLSDLKNKKTSFKLSITKRTTCSVQNSSKSDGREWNHRSQKPSIVLVARHCGSNTHTRTQKRFSGSRTRFLSFFILFVPSPLLFQ